MPVDPSCTEMCLEEIITLARSFYLFVFCFLILFIKNPYNFAFSFSFLADEKRVCATNMWSLNMHFSLTWINGSFVYNGNYLHYNFLLRYFLLGFSVLYSLTLTTVEIRAESTVLVQLLQNFILCILAVL